MGVAQYHIGGGGGQILINGFEFPIFSASWYFSKEYVQIRPILSFPRWTYIFKRSLNSFYSLPIFLIFHNCYISIHSLWDMDPCAGLPILAHGSIPLPYLPNLCAVLRQAPLASYYFPLLSSPLLWPCIGLSLGYPIGQWQVKLNCYFTRLCPHGQ